MSSKPTFDPEKQEPKENDKCMESSNEREEDSKWRRRLADFRKQTKDFASDHYKIIVLLLCILLFVFFIIIIVLAVKIGQWECTEEPECTRSQCLKAAANVVSKMNQSLDPCTDFFSYSCGQWIDDRGRIQDRKGSYSVLDAMKEDVYWKIRHLIDLVPSTTNEHSPNGKVKSFFTSCMTEQLVNYWSQRTLVQSIEEIGGWAILNTGISQNWNRNDMLSKLQVSYGVRPFFEISVGIDSKNPTRNIIKIIPAGLGLPGRNYYLKPHTDKHVRAYKEFIQDIIREFGGIPTASLRFAEDMFYYEKRLAEITPTYEQSLNDNESYQIVTIQELKSISPIITWLELLQSYYQNVDISLSTEVAILHKEYFRQISKIISSTDDEILKNYMMWRFLMQYIPHLPDNYRDIANRFYQTLEGVKDINVQSEDRWEFCIGQTIHYLGHAVSVLYVEEYFPEKMKTDVQKLVDGILAAVHEKISSVSWLSDTEIEMAQEKIRSMSINIGYPDFIRDQERLESYYKNYIVKTPYIKSIYDGEIFLRKKSEELLNEQFSADQNWKKYAVDMEAKYIYSGNRIEIPAGLLNFPIYDPELPVSIKYGALAGHIANKILEAFDTKGIIYEKYGILDPWLTNSSKDSFQDETDCLLQHVMTSVYNDIKLHSKLTVTDLISDIGGIKFAYYAYKNNDTKEGLLSVVKKNHDELFFISYAQSLCEISQPEKVIEWNDKYPIPNKLRVLGTLQQLPEFRKTFSCSDSSSMSPKKQCHIW